MKGKLEARLILLTGIESQYFKLEQIHKPPTLPSLIYNLNRYAQGQALKNYKINIEIK